MDMLIYAASGCPVLYPSRVRDYIPKVPGEWSGVLKRARRYPDDGHTAKLIRAILAASELPSSSSSSPILRQKDFLTIAHMAMDSVEVMLEPGYDIPAAMRELYISRLGVDEEVARIVARFVRWCGVEGAWDDFPDLGLSGDKGEEEVVADGKARL